MSEVSAEKKLEQRDSLVHTSSVESSSSVVAITQEVAASSSSITASIKDVESLPEGAAYVARAGRSSVNMQRKGDTIVVYAVCDSLERKVEIYASRLESTQRSLMDVSMRYDSLYCSHVAQETTPPFIKKSYWRWYVAGLITGGILVFVVYNRKKIFKLIKTIAYV